MPTSTSRGFVPAPTHRRNTQARPKIRAEPMGTPICRAGRWPTSGTSGGVQDAVGGFDGDEEQPDQKRLDEHLLAYFPAVAFTGSFHGGRIRDAGAGAGGRSEPAGRS